MDWVYSRLSLAVRILWITTIFCSQVFPNCSRKSRPIPPRLFPNCSDQGAKHHPTWLSGFRSSHAIPFADAVLSQSMALFHEKQNRSQASFATSGQVKVAATNPIHPRLQHPVPPWPQIHLCPDKLDFDRVICENVGPTLRRHHGRNDFQIHGRDSCHHQSSDRR